MFDFLGSNDTGRDADAAYASLNRKVDLILRALNVSPADFEDDTLPRHVRDLVDQGRKIQAIKEYREYARVGLKEAKDAVEGKEGPSAWALLNQKLDRILSELGVEEATHAAPGLTPGQTSEIEEMIRGGNLVGAIMVYREETGAGLQDAQTAVYELAARMREEQ